MYSWEKKGLIFSADQVGSWANSHASNPTPVQLSENVYRVYFSSRDSENKSHISFVDFKLPEFEIVRISKTPVLSPGNPGAFDDRGCSVGCTYQIGDTLYLFYLGWNLSLDVPFQNAVGMAVSYDNGESFKRKYIGPILDRSIYDPYSVSYPFIFKKDDDFYMIYGSHSQWGKNISDMIHGLKIAKSSDLINWEKSHDYIINTSAEDYAFSRPWIIDEESSSFLYCYRGKNYKIGLAHPLTEDLKVWKRDDKSVDLSLSSTGWDSEMVCYPSIINFAGNTYMLYCGNNFGKDGFGMAILKK